MKSFRKQFFTKSGNRKQSTIGRSFLLNVLQNDKDSRLFESSELFTLYGEQYMKKTKYDSSVVKKRFYSSLSNVKRILSSPSFYQV